MKKINFVNNSEPYLSAENLNQMQDNIENAILKTKVIMGSIEVAANTNETFRPDYSSIDGTIVASVLIGAVCTASNTLLTKLIPHVYNSTTEANAVTSVGVSSSTPQTVYINILVFYK